MKKATLFLSFLSTVITALCNFFLVRLLYLECPNDVVVEYLGCLNGISSYSLGVVHLFVFSYVTKFVSMSVEDIFSFFINRIKICFIVIFIGTLLFVIFIVPRCQFNLCLVLSILFLSFFIAWFWVLNAICQVLNKMSVFFLFVNLFQILLYICSVVFIPKFKTLSSIFFIYSFSYFCVCLCLLKKLFPQKTCVNFLSILIQKESYKINSCVNWHNLIFDILVLFSGLKIFSASVFWEPSLAIEFGLFWRFTEFGFILLDRFVDSQQGLIANILCKSSSKLKDLFIKITKISVLFAFLGGVCYVLIGKYLLSIWLDSDLSFNIPIINWYCGALFFIIYSILTGIRYFAFFTNNSQCIVKVFGLNVFLYFFVIILVYKYTSPYVLLHVSLLDCIFIPFYWKALNKKLKLI